MGFSFTVSLDFIPSHGHQIKASPGCGLCTSQFQQLSKSSWSQFDPRERMGAELHKLRRITSRSWWQLGLWGGVLKALQAEDPYTLMGCWAHHCFGGVASEGVRKFRRGFGIGNFSRFLPIVTSTYSPQGRLLGGEGGNGELLVNGYRVSGMT